MSDLEDHEYEEFFDGDDDGPDEEELQGKSKKLPSLDEMEEDTVDLEPSDYTQHTLLSYLVAAPELWVKCAPIIKDVYFDPQYRPVIAKIESHLKEYGDMPNPDMIHMATGVRLKEREDASKESRQEWVCDQVEEFCRTTAYQDHLLKAAEITATDKSRDTIAGLMKEATAISQISLVRNLGVSVHDGAVEILTESEKDDNITTGFKLMDRAFSGGLTRPSFNIVSCASGDGKSIFMQNMLVNYIEQGMNCIFYSLELEPAIVLKRFAAMMTGTAIDLVYSHLDTVGNSLRTRGKTDGSLWVKKFPMVGTSMADIAAHHLEIEMHLGIQFGAVAIDYIDVMDPVEKIDKANIHLKDKYVSEEINDWAHENGKIVWSASQQTKGAQDEKDARQSGVAGGTPKISTCDNLIIGKRNEDDTEDERWWGHVAKARSSGATKTKIPLHWNSKTMRMQDGDPDLFEEANPKLFNRKRSKEGESLMGSERIKNDPLAQEQGVEFEVKKEDTGKRVRVVDTLSRLRGITHQQEELKDGESD